MSAENYMSENRPKPRVAFVVQRCGREVNGGAESLCLQIAVQMAQHWSTEILTTCALDYVTWKNHFREGDDPCGHTTIRRFQVSVERDNDSFNRLSARLQPKQRLCSLAEQTEWMAAQGPNSPTLTAFIRENRDHYDAFIFFGYLYATTFDNLPLVADKAWLVPCAHDEWPIHFTMFDRLFALPRGFIFNTIPERDFARERFFHLELEGPVAGVGVEPPLDVRPLRFREKFGITGPFLLYCGRIDISKGCGEMLEAFLEWKRQHALPHQLVLIGKAVMPVPSHPHIVSLGFVTEADKWDAMAACDWLLMPSIYESLSLVLLEAWAVARPALVNAKCAVLDDHCKRSKAGLAFHDWDEACAAVKISAGLEMLQMGKNGQRYVSDNYTWETICRHYQGITIRSSASGLEASIVPTEELAEY
jgi:glycosyltransferase involved in cell wall biosynthesis